MTPKYFPLESGQLELRDLHSSGEYITLTSSAKSPHSPSDEVSLSVDVRGQSSFRNERVYLSHELIRADARAEVRYREDEGFTLRVDGELIAQIITSSEVRSADAPHLIVVRAPLRADQVSPELSPCRELTLIESSLDATLSAREFPHLERLSVNRSLVSGDTLNALASGRLKALSLCELKETRALCLTGGSLEDLEIDDLRELKTLRLESLHALRVVYCSELPKTEEITLHDLPSLVRVDLSADRFSGVRPTLIIESAPLLRSLKMEAIRLRDSNMLRSLPKLEELTVTLTDLSCLEGLERLITLSLSDDRSHDEEPSRFESLATLKSLESLSLDVRSESLYELACLAELSSLQRLDILSNPFDNWGADIDWLDSLTALREFNICCKRLRLRGDLSRLTHLESLYLDCEMRNLSALRGCSQIKHIRLNTVHKLISLEPLGDLVSITELSLDEVRRDHDLSPLSRLKGLKGLNLTESNSSRSLKTRVKRGYEPRSAIDLTALRGLDSITDLSLEMRELRNLEVLCEMPSLSNLRITYQRAYDLGALAGVTSLRRLDIRELDEWLSDELDGACDGLDGACDDLASLKLPDELKVLNLSGISSLYDLELLNSHAQLDQLDISSCPNLKTLRGVEKLPSLRSLSISHDDHTLDLSALKGLDQLEHINIYPLGLIRDFTLLKSADPITNLSLGFTSSSSVADARALEVSWSEPHDLTSLTSLEELTLGRCSVKGLETLSELRELRIDCGFYKSYQYDNACENPDCEDFECDDPDCDDLKDCPDPDCDDPECYDVERHEIERLSRSGSLVERLTLTVADLDGAVTVTSDHLEWLPALSGLQHLEITNAYRLMDISPLASLTGLRSLSLEFASELTDLSPLASLTELTALNLSNLKRLEDLEPLRGLTSLRSLNLSGCGHLKSLGPLKGFEGYLNTSWCLGLELQRMTPEERLEVIKINGLGPDGDLDSADPERLPATSDQRAIIGRATHNNLGLHPLQICSCYHCCTRYFAREITSFCDGGYTAICPHCAIDSVHIGSEPMSALVSYHLSMF